MPNGGIVDIFVKKISPEHLPVEIKDYEKEYIEIIFKDNGLGIKEEYLSKIFEPFFTTKKDKEALGLGLYVTYSIIKQHNGHIIVNSSENVGTEVKIYLPTITNTFSTIDKYKEVDLSKFKPKLSILLVNKDKIVLDTLKEALSKYNLKIFTATSIDEAKKILHEEKIDAVISDLFIENNLIVKLYNENYEINKDIFKIVLTNSERETDLANQLLDNPIILKKPISVKTIVNELEKYFAKQ